MGEFKGTTKGTYRSKEAKGLGVPTPPEMDYAWLKQWWPETSRREPNTGPGNVGATKSERRALLKKKMSIGRKDRLPLGTKVA